MSDRLDFGREGLAELMVNRIVFEGAISQRRQKRDDVFREFARDGKDAAAHRFLLGDVGQDSPVRSRIIHQLDFKSLGGQVGSIRPARGWRGQRDHLYIGRGSGNLKLIDVQHPRR